MTILLAGLCLCTPLVAVSGDYDRISSNDGLSNSSVNVIFQDSDDIIWIGTWDGLNRFDGGGIVQYRPDGRTVSSISHQVIRSISETDDRWLWIATDYGINRFDRRTEHFDRFFLDYQGEYMSRENAFSCCVSSSGQVAACVEGGFLFVFDESTSGFVPVASGLGMKKVLYFDNSGVLWAVSDKGMLCSIDIDKGSVVKEFSIPEMAFDLRYDGNGRLWFSTAGFLYYMEEGQVYSTDIRIKGNLNVVRWCGDKYVVGTTRGSCEIVDGKTEAGFLDDVSVLSVLEGSQDILWLGTDGRGVYRWTSESDFIASLDLGAGASRFPVRAVMKSADGNILVGCKGGGLSVISPSRNIRRYNVGAGRTYNSVLSLAEGDGQVWVGTDGYGVCYFDGSLKRLDLGGHEAGEHIGSVYSIVQSGKDTLYVGTSGEGMFRIILDGRGGAEEVLQYRYSEDRPSVIGSNIVYSIIDDGDYLWVGTRGGGLNRFRKDTGETEIFKNCPYDTTSLCSNDVISMMKDRKGNLWVGTTSGLSVLEYGEAGSFSFRQIDETAGLANTNIHAIREDCYGTVWVSTSHGLSEIVPETMVITNYFYEDGLQDNEFSDGAGWASEDGRELFFGGIAGVNVIYPERIVRNETKPKMSLFRVMVDGLPYMKEGDEIRVGHRTGSISLDFSVADYLDNRKCHLEYCLYREDGWQDKADRKWIDVGNDRKVLLHRLVPGRYTVEARVGNSSKSWHDALSFNIIVAPPVWRTWWAYIIYAAAAAGLCSIVVIFRRNRRLMHMELEKEKQEKLMKEEIHQAKLRFFTNIAHEFSNSITLIFGAVEQIMLNRNDDSEMKKLMTIRSNAERMHNQIQELMDFRKADTGHLHARYEKIDVRELVKYVLDNFMGAVDSKKIELVIDLTPQLPLWGVDRSMFEKIVFNLLSNAVKYTPTEGRIGVSLSMIGDRLIFTVSNSGPGIPPENLPDVFNRFTVLDNFESKLSRGLYSRNGIGLAMCRDLVQLMEGEITVDSKADEYTVFAVSLPQHEAEEVHVVRKPVLPAKDFFDKRRKAVLVVDDQTEIRELVCDILGGSYDILQASDGVEAMQVMEDVIPDLIISDVIMPRMDGIEFIEKVKSEEKTMYIPVIMLSSDSRIESRVSMLETGGDMSISKPFHPSYLKAAVDRILDNTEKMKTFSESFLSAMEPYKGLDISRDDRKFIEKAIDVLSRNFSDENYNQDALAEDLAISRVQLYRKIKSILSTTPGDFIRSYRLRQAENLLVHTDRTVQEIMFDCGFHNKAYFYREFTKVHGCSPKDFRQKKKV